MRNTYFVFVLIFFGLYGHAQKTIKFEHLTTEDGLSQSDVNTIFQDNDGFMWFGTHDGLNRYDGYKFTVFKPDLNNKNSISSNLIWKITGDKKGNLWIGTTGSGLNYFDKTTEKFINFRHDENNKNSITSDYITFLFKDSSNRLWVGSAIGIDILDLNKPVNGKFQHVNFDTSKQNASNNRINVFYEDSLHQIWIGGANGLHKLLEENNGKLHLISMNKLLDLPQIPVNTIVEDQFNNLIIGTTKGLYIYHPNKKEEKTQLIQQGFFTKVVINTNFIWAGTDDGLYRFSNTAKNDKPKITDSFKYDPKNPSTSLTKNSIKSILVDKTGIVWIGTNGGGVNKFDSQRKQFLHIKKNLETGSLSHDKIRSIFEDSKQNLWIGTEGGGLDFISNNKPLTNFQTLKRINKVFAIAEIQLKNSRKLFVGGENSPGLFEIDITNTNQLTDSNIIPINEIKSSVFAIFQDHEKNIWIGTYNHGVYRWLINNDGTSFTKDNLLENQKDKHSISNNIIRDILQDSKGNIWFATGDGLCLLNKNQIHKKYPRFEVYKNAPSDKTSISHNYILTIFESKKGAIWVGTLGGGLNKVIVNSETKNISFKRFTEQNGLPNNVIKGILEDGKGNLWISTNKGISRFEPKNETFQNYDANDGLQSNEFSELTAFKKHDGLMLFGGVNGFNAFYPDNIINNKFKAKTAFTSFSIFNKPVGIGEEIDGRVILPESINSLHEITIDYNENSFSFEFTSLHFAAPKKNKYAYKLEGFNDDWIYTTADNRFATYTNLQPGSYTLKVKSSNNDNVWDETPIELKIRINPPFWRSNLAYFFYTLLLIGLLFALRRFTIISFYNKHLLELDHFEKEKNEEIHRLKLEFFTNISHEFRTPLTLIKGPLDYLIKKGENLSQKEVKDQYALMLKNTTNLLKLVNQLLDFRKLDNTKRQLNLSKSNIVAFLKELGEPFQFLSHKKSINFEINGSTKEILTWFDPDAVEKIVNNLLSNAFKFTPKNGTITLDIVDGIDFTTPDFIDLNIEQNKYIIIQVKDSGPGIPAHRIQNIFDRFYTGMEFSNKLKTKSSGIGLSYTKNLVELHQGIIKVKSDPVNGSTFYVWLPKNKETFITKEGINFHEVFEAKNFISQKDAESHAVSFMDDIADKNISRSRSKLPILLLVEDNEDIRSFIKIGLGDNYYIYEAENGQIGLELAHKFMPNIIITDLMMPVMDGIEFCNRIKNTKETSHIPVVMLTAKTSQEKEIEGLKTGADAYIRKPFDLELLELKLTNILKYREELRKRFTREISLQPNEVTVTSSDENFLNQAIAVVEKHMMDTEFSVEMLVKEMNISRSNLFLKIKELTGLSSSEFIRNIRLKRAVQLFEKSDYSVKEIMYMTGFNTASYFSKCFKKQFGVIPSKYIKNADSETDSNEEKQEGNQ